jgi:hypothetical protein
MQVHVSPAFSGSQRHRLVFTHKGQHCTEYVRAEQWSRNAATDALDLLQYVYGVSRKSVRFCHH